MATVKGSRQEKMIVVPQRFWHEPLGKTLSVAALVLVAAVCFLLGRMHSGAVAGGAGTFLASVRSSAREAQMKELQAQVVKQEQAGSVDRLALQDLRVNIGRLREQISQLEEDVLFYKQIADSDRTETGLAVSQLDLIATEQPDQFLYKIKFEQMGDGDNMIEGYANIAVSGVKDNMELTLPLAALSNSMQGENIKLRFRSFQAVEGEITLPYGFEPSRVEILAVTEEPDSKTLQKNFSWLVESGQQVIAR